MRISSKQMTIGELVNTLKRKDQDASVRLDWIYTVPKGGVHSYRGYYEDLAIGYGEMDFKTDPKVSDVVKWLEDAIGKDFFGYKGGEYTMELETVVWVANSSESGGIAIVDVVELNGYVILKTELVD